MLENGAGIKQKTVVEQVMEQIKNLIADGTFKPGERIPTEPELSRMFGVGRSSVREAIKTFQYMGVMETKTSRGTIICDNSKITQQALYFAILLGKKNFFELVELREVMEIGGLKRMIALKKSDPALYKSYVEELESSLSKIAAPQTIEDFIVGDYKFHGTIINATRNSVFRDIYATLRAFMEDEILRCYQNIEDVGLLSIEHRDIIRTIESGTQQEAVDCLTLHIQRIRNRLEKSFRGCAG